MVCRCRTKDPGSALRVNFRASLGIWTDVTGMFAHWQLREKREEASINVLKLLLTYLICFLIGRLGFGCLACLLARIGTGPTKNPFVPPFNATPAGTVAYLIFQARVVWSRQREM